MRTLRFLFSKTDEAKFLSHLDLNRCFSRAVKRSGLDAWYTEGFHSHLYLLFALPLALGIESVCETVDVKFAELPEPPDAGERINPYLPEGVRVFYSGLPRHKSADIVSARYFIEFAGENAKRLERAVRNMLESEEIQVEKKGKGGVKCVNIRKQIRECDLVLRENALYLNALLDAGNETSLNPIVLMDQITERAGCVPEYWNIRRVRILTGGGESFE